jgi:hypothetical protein
MNNPKTRSATRSGHPDPDSGDDRVPPNPDQLGSPTQSGQATPGDLGAPDIVSPVGEEMPVQTHDEVDGTDDAPRRRSSGSAGR